MLKERLGFKTRVGIACSSLILLSWLSSFIVALNDNRHSQIYGINPPSLMDMNELWNVPQITNYSWAIIEPILFLQFFLILCASILTGKRHFEIYLLSLNAALLIRIGFQLLSVYPAIAGYEICIAKQKGMPEMLMNSLKFWKEGCSDVLMKWSSLLNNTSTMALLRILEGRIILKAVVLIAFFVFWIVQLLAKSVYSIDLLTIWICFLISSSSNKDSSLP